VDRLPAFQDDRLSEQHYRQAGVTGQGSWGQGQHQASSPWQSQYHFYRGADGHGSPMVSEVTAALLMEVFCI